MVAAAGESGELAPRVAWPLLIIALLLLMVSATLVTRGSLLHRIPLPLTHKQLELKAREAADLMQPAAPAVESQDYFNVDNGYFQWAREHRLDHAWANPDTAHVSPLTFRYRQSPRPLRPRFRAMHVLWDDPPFRTPGMANIAVDQRGNLLFAATVPLEKLPAGETAETGEVDWTPLIERAGFDPEELEPVRPQWSPPVPITRRFAWETALPGQPDVLLRIEAASWEGKPIWFEVFPPWHQPVVPAGTSPSALERIGSVAFVVVFAATLALAAFLAWRNVRRGRSDRSNAFRLSMAAFAVLTTAAVLQQPDRIWSSEGVDTLLSILLQVATPFAAAMCIYYLALEPYLRRRWPRTLISSTRLLSGRLKDPRVGRDIFFGGIAALVALLCEPLPRFLSSAAGSPIAPRPVYFDALAHLGAAISFLADMGVATLWYPLLVMLIVLLAHLILRNRVAAIILAIVIFAILTQFPEGTHPVAFIASLVAASIFVLTVIRWGLVAGAAAIFVNGVLQCAPLMLDPSSWLFPYTLLFLLPIVVLIVGGFYISLGHQPLFAEALLDE